MGDATMRKASRAAESLHPTSFNGKVTYVHVWETAEATILCHFWFAVDIKWVNHDRKFMFMQVKDEAVDETVRVKGAYSTGKAEEM